MKEQTITSDKEQTISFRSDKERTITFYNDGVQALQLSQRGEAVIEVQGFGRIRRYWLNIIESLPKGGFEVFLNLLFGPREPDGDVELPCEQLGTAYAACLWLLDLAGGGPPAHWPKITARRTGNY
jgi:hypothetical protein